MQLECPFSALYAQTLEATIPKTSFMHLHKLETPITLWQKASNNTQLACQLSAFGLSLIAVTTPSLSKKIT